MYFGRYEAGLDVVFGGWLWGWVWKSDVGWELVRYCREGLSDGLSGEDGGNGDEDGDDEDEDDADDEEDDDDKMKVVMVMMMIQSQRDM
jgi:hypothetical protein